jgi:hypothetical protein
MRAGKVVLDTLPSMLDPIIVVCDFEVKDYRKAHPRVKVVGTKARGIGATRAFICRYAVNRGMEVAGMLDDDITKWIYKEDPLTYGGIREATTTEVRKRWTIELARAVKYQKKDQGFACSFTWRTALAFPHPPTKYGVRLGMVNECMLMNLKAMRVAQFTLETCEDVESTIKWLLDGVIAGQDPHLGHGSPLTAHTAEGGGCGQYRQDNPGYHLKNHQALREMFPEVVCVPVDTGELRHGQQQKVKSRIRYKKAAMIGGLLP